jgi:integrase
MFPFGAYSVPRHVATRPCARYALYVDTLKNNRSRTVPLVVDLVPIVDRWSAGKAAGAWLFSAPGGGALRESNWKRSIGWSTATAVAGLQGFRVHDLRGTRRRRFGSALVLTRGWFSGCWGTPRRR